jgi:hypothetical protein
MAADAPVPGSDPAAHLCVEAGLVWGQELLADATRMAAKAAMDSPVPRARMVVDDELVALFDGGGADDAARWDLLAECRLDPYRPATGTYERISSRRSVGPTRMPPR